MQISNFIAAFAIFILLHGCITHQRCIDKFGIIKDVVVKDTLIFIPSVEVDTVFKLRMDSVYFNRVDTYNVIKENVSIKILRHRDTLRVWAQTKPDTIRIPIEKKIIEYSDCNLILGCKWYIWLIIGVTALAIIGVAILRILR